MEVMLRCAVPDRPGALAALAATIASAGGDILAVDVVEHSGGEALDDLVVALPGRDVRRLLAGIEHVDGVRVVHAGPSRGQPGDAATRLAVGLETMLNGATTPERGLPTVVGGLLLVDEATLVATADAPEQAPDRLVLALGDQALVLRRAYRFTRTERERALAVTRLCAEVARHVVGSPSSSSG
jgi:hypothetical protein